MMLAHEWINGLLGGMLIGVAAALFLALNGRIAGISGILGGGNGLPGRAKRYP